jgi:putative hydrolase of the HAD superfamily
MSYPLMLITKGDLFDQETKIARSGLANYFKHIEIVSEKTEDSYRSLLDRHKIDPWRFLMVGNSLKSDILPVLALGGQAVYIPHQLTWVHETIVSPKVKSQDYFQLEHLGQLPAFIESLSAGVNHEG